MSAAAIGQDLFGVAAGRHGEGAGFLIARDPQPTGAQAGGTHRAPSFCVMPTTEDWPVPAVSVGRSFPGIVHIITPEAPAVWALATFEAMLGLLPALRLTILIQAPGGGVPG